MAAWIMLLIETIFDTLNAKAAILRSKNISGKQRNRIADHDQRNDYRCIRPYTKRTNTRSILYFRYACKTVEHWIELCIGCKGNAPAY